MSRDLQIIEKLEKETGKKFKQLSPDKITKVITIGYSIDENENITGLNLFSLRLLEHSFLKELKNLTALNLSSNQISDISFLKELKNLTSLNLSSNQISDISFLQELKNLTTLNLRNNNIQNVSFLKELKNLTTLNLHSNDISDISFLKELKNLTTLDLSKNEITDYSFLKEFKNLTELSIWIRKISDYSFLKELKNLTTLDLFSNQISDYSFLKEFKNLTTLNLYSNNISDISFLKELKNLTTLYLGSNNISDISFLKELKNLTTLDLSSNQISDYSFLKEFKNLTTLDLSSNQISDYSFLKEFKNLTTLDLSSNQISDYSFLKEFKNLTTLNLSSNQISDISFLQELKNLTTLNLGSNQISDISFLQELKYLTTLNLRSNQISNYSFLQELKYLTTLDLSSNQISDISFLKELKYLTTLDLSSNQISDISFLKELKNLTTLNLGSNQISDISFLKELKYLRSLNLGRNKISKLNPDLLKLDLEIVCKDYFSNGLNLFENPLETPPVEIVKKGKDAVKAYFKSLEGEKQPLNEVKVLLVGDGGSGKTSLVKRLLGQQFNANESQTHGINIRQWEIPDGENKIKVHLWDFGGQEIMHATHQFFLSKRSLYVLVLDGRKEEKTEYWLKHIESFGGDSPVLVVLNKIDENPSFEVNCRFLQEKYKGIKGYPRVSCRQGTGIDSFKELLTEELRKVELCHTPFAKSWFNVKDQLENMIDNFISYNKYLEMCLKENIIDETSQDTLVGFLNDLGLILHFRDFNLKDTYVLEPKWVTNAVYKIINSEKLCLNKGVLKLNKLDEILKKKHDEVYFYPREKYKYIIDLMKKFELCYDLDSNAVLIPDLLEVQEPTFDFDYADSLKFIFEYDFLPRSVMPRFIVRMHKDIKDELRWRTGVVLEDKDNVYKSTAVMKADERDKKIFIYVNGEQKRNYFTTIRKEFRNINGSFEKLEVKELVPLPDNDKITVEYDDLVGYEKGRRDEYYNGKLQKAYSVKKLLDGIEEEEERMDKSIREQKIELHVDNSEVYIGSVDKSRKTIGNNNIDQKVSGTGNQTVGKGNENKNYTENSSNVSKKPAKKSLIDWINPPATIAAFIGLLAVEIGIYLYSGSYNHIIGVVIAIIVFVIVAIYYKR